MFRELAGASWVWSPLFEAGEAGGRVHSIHGFPSWSFPESAPARARCSQKTKNKEKKSS